MYKVNKGLVGIDFYQVERHGHGFNLPYRTLIFQVIKKKNEHEVFWSTDELAITKICKILNDLEKRKVPFGYNP